MVIPRLPRFGISTNGFGPGRSALPSRFIRPRWGSPFGGSTLMTSAPRSAMAAPAAGTKVHEATSSTRTPSKGWLTASPLLTREVEDTPGIVLRDLGGLVIGDLEENVGQLLAR